VPTASELFEAHVADPNLDPTIGELRRRLTQAKLETMDQVQGLDEAGLKLVMPGLYQQIVAATIQISAHCGLAVGMALEAYDELTSGCSVSSFSREVRQQMTETGVELKRRHSSRIAKLVAEVEAQRLAWRHSHEFLSWLAFRRDDERYTPEDRRERMVAFKIQPRLMQSREAVAALLGRPLTVMLEGHDRFMLANRWRLEDTPEHSVERMAWPLLAYQPAEVTALEIARNDYDAMVSREAPDQERDAAAHAIVEQFRALLQRSLDEAPDPMDVQVM
jgi:hypothetical protein